MLSNRERPDATPIALTPEGRKYSDLAWAPTLDRNVVAMARRADPRSTSASASSGSARR